MKRCAIGDQVFWGPVSVPGDSFAVYHSGRVLMQVEAGQKAVAIDIPGTRLTIRPDATFDEPSYVIQHDRMDWITRLPLSQLQSADDVVDTMPLRETVPVRSRVSRREALTVS